ncbi:MAG: PUR family DNA/RNA-binding protein [Flavobacteriales bacterium]|nr:PUR family DNA/RNA-binding protein [Flavobacteriales bacterium]
MAEDREDVYSKAVRAGKRTYFFDVKSTRGRDLFLTITESKKHTHEDGSASYEKHKIFLYKEDFDKFMDGLQDAFSEIDRLRNSGEYIQEAPQQRHEPMTPDNDQPSDNRGSGFNDVDFDDLGRKDT